jgi:DNA modification methylase
VSEFERVINSELQWSLHRGSCLDLLRALPDNCADACVTDPPYELTGNASSKRGFMGQAWDGSGIAFRVELWKEVLRVLKPGGHLLAFGGTRTYHRMACAIEDAGFEIRDSVHWSYGSGFPHYLSVSRAIDESYRRDLSGVIKRIPGFSATITELWIECSRRVASAEPLSQRSTIGTGMSTQKSDSALGNATPPVSLENSSFNAIIAELRSSDLQLTPNESTCFAPRSAGQITLQSPGHATSAELSLESQSVLLGQMGSSAQCDATECTGENRERARGVVEHLKTWNGRSSSLDPEATNAVCAALTETLRHIISSQSKTFRSLDTTDQMACASAMIATSTAFTEECLTSFTAGTLSRWVQRELDGIVREVVGTYTASGNAGTSTKDKGGTFAVGAENSAPIELKRTIGATDKSRAWDGWATALRPSHEPIVVARKPFSGTVVDNILTNRVGALNIDACRVPRNAATERGESWAKSGNTAQPDADKIAAPPGNGINSHPLGGWPGNVVLTHDFKCSETACVPECPCHVMGEMSGSLSNGGQNATSDRTKRGELCYGEYGPDSEPTRFAGDSGTAARYFNQSRWTEQDDPFWPGFYYCSKAGTAERELGCEKLPKKSAAKLTESQDGAARLNCPSTGAGRTSEGRANFHPTVKPLELMRWLCRLVTPKNGIIIEPFGGSGSGIMAPILEGFRCIASELIDDYWPIIEARVAWAERERFNATRQLQLFG